MFHLRSVLNGGITWYEIDDVQDLDIAQVMFAQTKTPETGFNAKTLWRILALSTID
ncbi:hypothetical protein MGH68_04905 [Erysipelothrix sp. D19-032]